MEQDGKPWLHEFRRKTLTTAVVYPIGWLVFVYGFGDSYEKTSILMLALVSLGIAMDGVFWLLGRLWARWWAWIGAG